MENIYSKENTTALISIVATKSNTGKTTLIEKLIEEFTNKGYTVGALKHDSHNFEIDKEGKDSYRFSKAGAKEVVIASSKKIACIKSLEEEEQIKSLLDLFGNVDIVFVEGFKNNKYPKIEVHRRGHDDKFLFNDDKFDKGTFLALATDEKVEGILNLDLNNICQIVDFIEDFISTQNNVEQNVIQDEKQLVAYDYKSLFKAQITKVEGEEIKGIEEDIIGEYPLAFILNGKYVNTFLCTPQNLKELVVGFLTTKGYIENKQEIQNLNIDEDNRVVYVNTVSKDKACNGEIIFLNSLDYVSCKPVENNDVLVKPETIYKLMSRNLTYSKLFKDTGGVHCIAIFDNDKEIVIREDVARHNAMDKAIGHCVLEDIGLKDKVIFVSGRISLEMILKAAQTQIPIVISKSAPTNLSIELAKRLNITLVGFVRGERMNIYTNPHRVILDKR